MFRLDVDNETVIYHRNLQIMNDTLRKRTNVPPNYPMMFFWALMLVVSLFVIGNIHTQLLKLTSVLNNVNDVILLQELRSVIELNNSDQNFMDKLLHTFGGPRKIPTSTDIIIATNNVINNHLTNIIGNEFSNIASQCGWERNPERYDFTNIVSFKAAQAITATKNVFSGNGVLTCITSVSGAKAAKAMYYFTNDASILSATIIGLTSAIWSNIYFISVLVPLAFRQLIKACGNNPSTDVALMELREPLQNKYVLLKF